MYSWGTTICPLRTSRSEALFPTQAWWTLCNPEPSSFLGNRKWEVTAKLLFGRTTSGGAVFLRALWAEGLMVRKPESLLLCKGHTAVLVQGTVLEEKCLQSKICHLHLITHPQSQSAVPGLKTSLAPLNNCFPDSTFLTLLSSVFSNSGPQLGNGKIQNLAASNGYVPANTHLWLMVSQDDYISYS